MYFKTSTVEINTTVKLRSNKCRGNITKKVLSMNELNDTAISKLSKTKSFNRDKLKKSITAILKLV